MSNITSSQAKVALNVRVLVGKPDNHGGICVRLDKRFKNTATRIMTESICNYLAGAENTYKRGHGRPNYMGIGTMGITRQPFGETQTAEVEEDFENRTYIPGESTRPWFESTSLALTNVCGGINTTEAGVSTHFWDPEMGWGKDGFTGDPSDEPIFQGELCTANVLNVSEYDSIDRFPILRADVLSDCPADWDYGTDGYCSQVIFYGYASVELVHSLLKPTHAVQDEETGEISKIPVGPQLDLMAVSEFGLYEKSNTDAHGLETMLAGFRVPTADDIIYVSDGEVILVEWRVSVRALMPYEAVGYSPDMDYNPKGIALDAVLLGEDEHKNKHIKMSATILPRDIGTKVPQLLTWELLNASGTTPESSYIVPPEPGHEYDSEIELVVGADELDNVLYVTAKCAYDPFIKTRSVILTGLITDYVIGIELSVGTIEANTIQMEHHVLGRGSYSQEVTWLLEGLDTDLDVGTSIDRNGLITISPEETNNKFSVTATSVVNNEVYAAGAILRTGGGVYTISDFTILT